MSIYNGLLRCGVSILAVAGFLLCLDGILVLVLAYPEENNQGLPPPCDYERATTAIAPCSDTMLLCEEQNMITCPFIVGDVFVQAEPDNYWPRGCTRANERTLCVGILQPCYKKCWCVWNFATGLCEPDLSTCWQIVSRTKLGTVPCPPPNHGGGS